MNIYKVENGWSLTMQPPAFANYESAYDFEDCIRRNIDCRGIKFDSEFCQFWAYAKTKARLESFSNKIEKHFNKVKQML